jgi:RNA polymerase sigma-70 factor (ECF subfamily)
MNRRRDDHDELAKLVDEARLTGWHSPFGAPGTVTAAERVLTIIRPVVARYCRARVGLDERAFASADDIAQEVCLAVFTSLPSYRDQGHPFLAFVYGIAHHKIADAQRTASRNRAEPVAEVPDTPDNGADPAQHTLRAEQHEHLARLLDVLPDNHREILVLRVALGLSADETASVMKSTPGAIRVTQHRALTRLRELLTLP